MPASISSTNDLTDSVSIADFSKAAARALFFSSELIDPIFLFGKAEEAARFGAAGLRVAGFEAAGLGVAGFEAAGLGAAVGFGTAAGFEAVAFEAEDADEAAASGSAEGLV